MASIKKRPEPKKRQPIPRSRAVMDRYQRGLYTPFLRAIDAMFKRAGLDSPVLPDALKKPKKAR